MAGDFSFYIEKNIYKVSISCSTLFFFAVLSCNIKWGFVKFWTPPSSICASQRVASCTYTVKPKSRC